MAVSLSWTRHSSTSYSSCMSWIMYLSFGYHIVFRASILVLGQCCQFHSVLSLCSREVIQLIFVIILLSIHSMFSFLDPISYQHHSISIMITVLCRWWGIHQGPLAMGCFLSTSTHYSQSWLRNIPQYLGAFIHQWQVSSLSETSLHQWPSTESLYVVFDINSFTHTIWIVL